MAQPPNLPVRLEPADSPVLQPSKPMNNRSSTQFKCTLVVLVLLALITAGGSGYLFYLSDGIAHLQFFIPADLLAATCVGTLIGIAVESVRYARSQKALLQQGTELEGETVGAPANTTLVLRRKNTEEPRDIPADVVLDPESSDTESNESRADAPPAVVKVPVAELPIAGEIAPNPVLAQIASFDRQGAWEYIEKTPPDALDDAAISALVGKIGVPTNEAEANWLLPHLEKSSTRFKDRDFATLEYANRDSNQQALMKCMHEPDTAERAQHIARHPQALLAKLAAEAEVDGVLALRILEEMPMDDNDAVLDDLFEYLGEPRSPQEAETFACHPKALLRNGGLLLIARYPAIFVNLVVNHSDHVGPDVLVAFYKEATVEQKTKLLEAMADLRDSSIVGVANVAWPLISHLIDEIARGNPSSTPEERTNLITQMARWPKLVAQSLFLVSFADLSKLNHETALTSELYKSMDDGAKTIFENEAVHVLSNRKGSAQLYPNIIENVATDREKRVPFFVIMAQTPILVAEAAVNMEEAVMDPIVRLMKPEQQKQYRLHFTKIYKKPDFDARLTGELKDLQKKPQDISQSYVLAYLTQFPGEFKRLVLTNDELGDEKVWGDLALNLLRHMGESAEAVIPTMDDNEVGYPYYNYLTNKLVKAVQVKSHMSERLVQLIARFDLAMAEGKYIKDITREKPAVRASLSGLGSVWSMLVDNKADEWQLLPHSKEVWGSFDKAAHSQIGKVYLKK